MFANYPILDLNHEVAALELSFFVLQTMKLGCGQYRFDVGRLAMSTGTTSWVVSQDAMQQLSGISFHRSLVYYKLKSQPCGNWYPPLGMFKYGFAQCRLYYNTN